MECIKNAGVPFPRNGSTPDMRVSAHATSRSDAADVLPMRSVGPAPTNGFARYRSIGRIEHGALALVGAERDLRLTWRKPP